MTSKSNKSPAPKSAPHSHSPENPSTAEGRKPRSDGAEARERLLHTALRLFAEKGFAKTSTREIAQAAEVNIASISYYFGDKAGLYRAAFTEPMGCGGERAECFLRPQCSLREYFGGFFSSMLEPMKQSDLIQLCTRLHFREMLEPTGLWAEKIDNGIKPAHAALVALLSRHLNITKPDDDVHRLAFSIVGLVLQILFTRDVITSIRPKLIATPDAIDQWVSRMVDNAEAMVAVEVARRKSAGRAPAVKKQSVKKTKS
jgi:AcrR family transcriptional regulator